MQTELTREEVEHELDPELINHNSTASEAAYVKALRDWLKMDEESKRLREQVGMLVTAFQHIHVRSDNGDVCAKCGLDLRNEIHERWGATSKEDGK